MNKILVSYEEVAARVREYAEGRGILPSEVMPDDLVDITRRAQVLKVVEWMERETAPHDPNHYWMGARRILREETLAALREAAGEGK